MLGRYFGYAITLKSIVAFMDLFNDIQIASFDENDTQAKLYTVPINFISPEKFLAMRINTALNIDQNKDLNPSNIESQLIVPRIAVGITDLVYDNARKFQRLKKLYEHDKETADEKSYVYTGVPYIINFEMYIITKKVFDLFQILEQIVPFFTPTLSLDITYIPDLGSESVPIKLDSISLEIPTDIATEEERLIQSQLTFSMKVNYYLPEFTGKKIKRVDIDYYDMKDVYDKFLQYVITPVNPISQRPPYENYEEEVNEEEE